MALHDMPSDRHLGDCIKGCAGRGHRLAVLVTHTRRQEPVFNATIVQQA